VSLSAAGIPAAYILAFLFVFGLLVGSFLNVVIHRLPLGESIVFPRSRCPSCRSLIPLYWNVPILSFLLLRGKCSRCGGRISWRYPIVELLTGLLFAAEGLHQPALPAWPFHFYFLGAVVACAFIDLDHWILPDKITLPGILIGFLGSFFVPGQSWLFSLLGILLGGGILYAVAWAYLAVTGRDGLGGGDIKFLAMVGAFLGVQGALITLIFSSFVGSLLGLFLMLVKGKKGQTAIPFGPFLSAGALLAFFFGRQVWRWYFGWV
jgi:leader peptidase (prepilin peptidase)/N-methyltransferase